APSRGPRTPLPCRPRRSTRPANRAAGRLLRSGSRQHWLRWRRPPPASLPAWPGGREKKVELPGSEGGGVACAIASAYLSTVELLGIRVSPAGSLAGPFLIGLCT